MSEIRLSVYLIPQAQAFELRLDTYAIHRLLCQAFAASKDRVLFLDKGYICCNRAILIQSASKPLKPTLGEITTLTMPEDYLDHTANSFEIVINPARRCKATGKIIALTSKAEIADWFESKAHDWGFIAEKLRVEDVWGDRFQKRDALVTLCKARIIGCLTVFNRDLFRAAVINGIGRGKAFGCGLMQLGSMRGGKNAD